MADHPHDWYAALGVIPPLPGARCAGHQPLFDDRVPGETPKQRTERITWAVRECERCPALAACRVWAEEQTHRRVTGVVAAQYFAPPALFTHTRAAPRSA